MSNNLFAAFAICYYLYLVANAVPFTPSNL